MAIKLVQICDGHMNATQDEVPGETIPPVTMPNGKRKVLDLCGECRETVHYNLLIDLLEEFGRDADADKRVSRATPQKQDIPPEERSQCRFCDRNDFRTQGRKMHERRSHVQELAALEREEAEQKLEKGDITVPDSPAELESYCQVCDQQLSSPSALNTHKTSRKHLENLRNRRETANA